MEQYIPLIDQEHHDEPTSSVDTESADGVLCSQIDLEKVHEPASWHKLPKWSAALPWTTPADSASKPWSRVILSYLLAIVPRFLRPDGWKQQEKLHATAWLDALRGWAAVSVYYFHTYYDYVQGNVLDRGTPILAGFLNGRAMVQVFFVISGYAVSGRILKLLRKRQQQPSSLLRALASSAFRRWFRLFVSAGVASFVDAVFVHFRLILDEGLRKESFFAQIWDWLCDFVRLTNPFASIEGFWHPDVFASAYLNVLWTIPAEFRGSIAVFWFLTASTSLSTRTRRTFAIVVILLCCLWGVLYITSFLVGMLIADFAADHSQPLEQSQHLGHENGIPTKSSKRSKMTATIGWGLLLLLGLLLLGQPPPDHFSSGNYPFPWKYFHAVIPPWYNWRQGEEFWLSIASALLLISLHASPALRTPLNFCVSQHLGYLSFGVYTMHVVVKDSFFSRVERPWTASMFPDSQSWWTGVPGNMVNTLVVLWMADYFARVDGLVVRLGKRLEEWCFEKVDG